MKTINVKCRALLSQALASSGSYDPGVTLYRIEESLTAAEYRTLEAFLSWCFINRRTFGTGNIDMVFAEWRARKT